MKEIEKTDPFGGIINYSPAESLDKAKEHIQNYQPQELRRLNSEEVKKFGKEMLRKLLASNS